MGTQSIADYVAYAMKVANAGNTSTIQSDISLDEKKTSPIQLKSVLKERRLLSLAMQMSFDGIIMGDPNGNIAYVNNAVLEMSKAKKEDFLGKNMLEFMPQREHKRALQLSLQAMSTGEGYRSEFFALTKDGFEILVEVAAAVVKDNGKAIGFIDIIRDITERKKAEDYLKKQAALIDLSPSAIIIKNSDEIITFWSIGAEKLYGYSKEEALGQRIGDLLKAKYTRPMNQILVELQKENHWIEEVTHYSKENQKIVVQTNWLAILDENRRVTEILESNVDITAHKKAEEEALKKAEERYLKAERLAAIGQLAAMVGHDLRNPLAGIKNAVYVLRKKQGNFIGESGNDMLNTIDKAVEHADSIISDLLDYSRELHLQIEENSTKSLIDYAILSLKVPSNIKITERCEDVQVRCDGNKLQRVFLNIIKNSLDAMPNGGQLEISSFQEAERISFIFADTGIGMSEDVIAKIFTPLFTTKAQGMGLGLAICKRFVEAHGGNITVESSSNKGTKFIISLLKNKPEN